MSVAQFTDQTKLLPQPVLDQFKYEIASDLGLTKETSDGYWGEISSRDCGKVGGKIGGQMVRMMIQHAEEALLKGTRL
ncbi:MAG: small, acid-soluble spore protein, alpha/beta type [Bacillota bacterium]